jgi:TRAP-type C4-dicarboxylate transport system permease large subunit
LSPLCLTSSPRCVCVCVCFCVSLCLCVCLPLTEFPSLQLHKSASDHFDIQHSSGLAGLASLFFYKLLHTIVLREKLTAAQLSSLLLSRQFVVSLYSCSAEIVVFAAQVPFLLLLLMMLLLLLFPCLLPLSAHSFLRVPHASPATQFPWILQVLDASPFEFQKAVEPVIRAENGLSKPIIKHLGL